MGVTSLSVWCGDVASGFVTLFTVPQERTLLLRRGVLLATSNAAAAGFYVSDAGDVGWLTPLTVVALNDTREAGYVILNPGAILGVYTAAAGFTVVAGGSLLHGEPS